MMTMINSPVPNVSHFPVSTAARSGPLPVTFGLLVAVEARKLINVRSRQWLLIITLMIIIGVLAIAVAISGPETLTFASLSLAAGAPLTILLPLLGIFTATEEWTSRTGLSTFTLEPRRIRIAAAKLVTMMIMAVITGAAALILGALANVAGLILHNGNGAWGITMAQLGGGITLLLMAAVQGVAFGLLLMNSTAAVMGCFLLPTLWTFVSALVPFLQPVRPWTDLSGADTALLAGTLRGEDLLHFFTALGIWLVLPLLIGGLRLTRREVK